MKRPTSSVSTLRRGLPAFAAAVFSATLGSSPAAVTPGGTLGDKALIFEAVGGEQLTRATAAGATGPVLVHDFDSALAVDGSYELNPSGADATQAALSSGRHLILYNTRFHATAGSNRAEIQTNLTLAGMALAAGRSQGYIRRNGGADEAVLSGGAILNVAADDDILTMESRRTDTNTNASVLPTRIANLTQVQLLKLDDTWDYLSLELSANQTGVDTAAFIDVAYDNNASPGTLGTAFSVAGGDITLNEAGLYLVFANTSIEKATNNTRTQYQQRLTLDGTMVAGSTTTTYVRGNEDTNEGTVAIGTVISATAGQVLNVEVNKEVGVNGVIQGGETALTMIKLPATAEWISLLDTTNQEVNDNPGPDPVTFATQVDASSSKFSHTGGESAVTVNQDSDYLFFGTVFTLSDGTNDNQDRIMPLHGWQIDGAGGPIDRGRGCQYNRDNGGRTSGSWGAAILPLTNAQTVQLTTERLGNADQGADSTIAIQGLSIQSLIPSNDPLLVKNNQLSLLVNTTGTITTALLESVDADDAPADLTYTVTSAPTGGTLKNNGAVVAMSGTFTQADVDGGLVTFEAGGSAAIGGFDFSVADDSGSGNIVADTFVVGIGAATVLTDDDAPTDEDTILPVPAPGVLANDSGTGLSVTGFDATSPQGATININPDGSATYDPTGAPALQALDDGDSVVDSFTYTVTDFSFTETTANINVTVSGVNDDPVVVDDASSGSNQSVQNLNVLGNDSDVDASDILKVVSINGTAVGIAGASALSPDGATISVSASGVFSYDPSTSATVLGLAGGATQVDSFPYEVSDGTATIQGTITITSLGATGANNDVAAVNANVTVNFAPLANDSVFGAAGTPTAGALVDFNAADVGNTDTTWINNGTTATGVDMTMESPGSGSVLNTNLVGAPVGITAAYDLSGTGSGAALEDADNANSIYGANIASTSMTLEMVFRPDELDGDEPLWGTGGNGTGSSLVLLGDQLIFTAGQNAIVVQVIGTLPTADYVHVIVTLDLATDTAELYINNVLADSATAIDISTGAAADITDWSGTDNEGLGRSNGTTGGDINVAPFLGAQGTTDIPDFNEANDRFEGEIAIFRIYSGTLLDGAQRLANFEAVFGQATPAVVGDVIEIAGTAGPTPPQTINLPSGATVTFNVDGSFTYDPNSEFDHVGTGLEGRDSFNYSLNSSTAATATVTVRITGTNASPQLGIAENQSNVTEGSPAQFTISSTAPLTDTVTVNLTYSGTAQDGPDFTGSATAVINAGGTPFALDLPTTADALFEGAENLVVTLDSIASGTGVIGATPSAGTTIDDSDSPPVFTITGGGAVTEGSNASFTVNASVASAVSVSLDLTYGGTATAADFNPVSSLTLPAGQDSAALDILALDDAIVDPGETLIATINNPSLGSVGAPADATATISDGAGSAVFMADFEGVNPLDTPGGTLLNADAPFAANLGTAIGTWTNVFTVDAGGNDPGVITEGGADVKGDGVDSALRLDRPGAGFGDVFAQFDGALDISGAGTGVISFDLATRRTQNNSIDKSTTIVGLDEAGNKSFELFVDANNNGAAREQLFHVDSGGLRTPIGNTEDFNNSGNYNEDRMTQVRITLTTTGYTVAIDRFPLSPAFTPTAVTGELSYAGNAAVVTKVLFAISGSADANISGGIYVDNVQATGSALTLQEAWRIAFFGDPGNAGAGADNNDANGNGLSNLLDFLYGFNPAGPNSAASALEVDNPGPTGTITQHGGITIWPDPATGDVYMRYPRRADHVVAGLNITDQFSRDLLTFEDSVDAPEVIGTGTGDDGVAIEAVQIRLPLVLPVSGGKARFGRNEVQINP